jgi:hypothetical protein
MTDSDVKNENGCPTRKYPHYWLSDIHFASGHSFSPSDIHIGGSNMDVRHFQILMKPDGITLTVLDS